MRTAGLPAICACDGPLQPREFGQKSASHLAGLLCSKHLHAFGVAGQQQLGWISLHQPLQSLLQTPGSLRASALHRLEELRVVQQFTCWMCDTAAFRRPFKLERIRPTACSLLERVHPGAASRAMPPCCKTTSLHVLQSVRVW